MDRAALSRAEEPDPTVVLDGIDLALEAGARLVLLGPSGGGKTSLLRVLNRLVSVEAGTVSVLGRPVEAWPPGELRRRVLFVPQAPQRFVEGGTLRTELLEPLAWRKSAATDPDLRAALELAGLEPTLERSALELSGGELQRLGLARAVLLAPPLLLLDEPTAALDVRTARELLARLREWAKARGTTLAVVSHSPHDAVPLEAEVRVLLGGHLRGPFSAADVAAGQVDDPEVAAFLGAAEGRQ